MDFNSYVFLVPLVLVTVPGLFFPFWNTAGDFIRLIMVDFIGVYFIFNALYHSRNVFVVFTKLYISDSFVGHIFLCV